MLIHRPEPSKAVIVRRLDQALVDTALFESRAKAREAIEAGLVTIDGRQVTKPAARVAPNAKLAATPAYPWVSRGGVKLAAALDRFEFHPAGRVCLDVGASTGGFTDVLLARGAARVYALDVGRGQLHARLGAETRVVDWSETDIRSVARERFTAAPTLAVCDVSFISLALVVPAVTALLEPGAELVALIKPQFEVGPKGTSNGIVRSEAARAAVCERVCGDLAGNGWQVLGWMPSPLTGGDGNIEFLVGARRR